MPPGVLPRLPPTSNPAIRRAMLHAFSQADFMQAIVGNDAAMYHVPHGVFCPGTPMASEAGLEPLKGPRDLAKVKEMLKQAGYANEKVTLLAAVDYAQFKAIGEVMADVMLMSEPQRPVGALAGATADDGARP